MVRPKRINAPDPGSRSRQSKNRVSTNPGWFSSTSEQVADVLRENILNGELKPGAPLREQHIAKMLGISRNMVREAMRLLAREGLVTYHLHRGVVVPSSGKTTSLTSSMPGVRSSSRL
jgi:DNA-binding FadR family transcriptional regulator